MKSTFYYESHYRAIAGKIKNHINSLPEFLSKESVDSTRAAGDAIEKLISENFDSFLGDWCKEYSGDFSRRAMADLAFTDNQGIYSVVDVKTHREDTKFNMPNLTSVERLTRFYESDSNAFSLIMVKYSMKGTKVHVSEIIFVPIEFLDWSCLTVGALGWGQIQIADSNYIKQNDGYSRKQWMLELFETMLEFYPKEILKIQDRMTHFEREREHWKNRKDIWA